MKYILIRGNNHSGKATTVKELCKHIQPREIFHLRITENEQGILIPASTREGLADKTYICTVGTKKLLVLPASPTYQRVKISQIMDALAAIKITIDFGIIAINKYEKIEGYSSREELERYGHCIHEQPIQWIAKQQFHTTEEWRKRIRYLISIAQYYI